MFGGSYGIGGAKPRAGITALARDDRGAAMAEADARLADDMAGFKGTWSGGYDLYEVAEVIAPGPLSPVGAASLDDLPRGARFIARALRGGTNV